MAIRWRLEFVNEDRENPTTFRVDIDDNLHVGAITNIIGTSSPVVYTKGRKGQNIFNDKYKSTFCEISLKNVDGEFDDINQSNDRFTFELYRNNSLMNRFFVLADIQGNDLTMRQPTFKIRGVDGLGLLKTKPLVDGSGDRYEGIATVQEWLERAFEKINTYPVTYVNNLEYRGFDYEGNIYLDASLFYRDASLEVDVFCSEVIDNILSPDQFCEIYGGVNYVRSLSKASETQGNTDLTCETTTNVFPDIIGKCNESILTQDFGTLTGSAGGIILNPEFANWDETTISIESWGINPINPVGAPSANIYRKITENGYGISAHLPSFAPNGDSNYVDTAFWREIIFQRFTLEAFDSSTEFIALGGELNWCLAGQLTDALPPALVIGGQVWTPLNEASTGQYVGYAIIKARDDSAYFDSNGDYVPLPSLDFDLYNTAKIEYTPSGTQPSQPFLNELGNVSITLNSLPTTTELEIVFVLDIFPFAHRYQAPGEPITTYFVPKTPHSLIIDKFDLAFEPLESYTDFGRLDQNDTIQSLDAVVGGEFSEGTQWPIDGTENGVKYDGEIFIGNTPKVGNAAIIFKGSMFEDDATQAINRFTVTDIPGDTDSSYGEAIAKSIGNTFKNNVNRLSLTAYNSDILPADKLTDPSGQVGNYFINYIKYDLKGGKADIEALNFNI